MFAKKGKSHHDTHRGCRDTCTGQFAAASIVAKATLITVLALIATRMVRRSRAAVRHTLLAAAFVVLLGLPVAALVAPPIRIAVPADTQTRTAPPPLASAVDATQAVPGADVSGAVVAANPRFSLSAVLLAGWFAGAAMFLLPVLMGLRQVRALRRSGLPFPHGQSVAEELARDAGIYRRVEVLLHESLPGPMTCGAMHPAIVFPADARGWDRNDLKRAILHELEHVRRGDWVTHCLARVVCAVYWFHPLVWIARRQLVLEAERACDDAVLGHSDPEVYADQLVELARRLSTVRKSSALAMANRSDLSARVGAVLDSRQRRGRAGAILVAIACVAVAALVVMMSPLRMVAAPQLAFEVASIKPIDPNVMHRGGARVYPGGRVVIDNTTLKSLVTIAFHLSYWQISGGEAWTEKDRYDIEAKPPENLEPSITNLRHSNFGIEDERLREMLQAMLIDRFQLKFHRETKTGKVYLLERNGKTLGLRLSEATSPMAANSPEEGFSGDVGFAGGRWVIFNTAMPQLAKFAADFFLHAPVLDRTGLSGSFDYKQSTRLSDSEVDYSHPPFLELMPELGLKIESSTGPIESFVIDQADKPSPN